MRYGLKNDKISLKSVKYRKVVKKLRKVKKQDLKGNVSIVEGGWS
jgi:hypothetical protein